MDEINEEEQFTAEKPPVEEVPPVESSPEPVTVPERATEVPLVEEQTYTVLEGEKLGDIAKKLNIAGGWPALFHKNRDIIGENPSKVVAGTTLVLP